ncbi:AraC family transcriptional regulator, partial [Chelativorans sp.]|uniref:AraC family transcriptional regulator n=1 Tax=Chelativorans sp. TaxID=2203393 RepID=UPI0028115B7E
MMAGDPDTADTARNAISVVAEMERILDTPPDLVPRMLRGDTLLTRRWRHGALHDTLPAMRGHVVMTYYSQPQEITWQSGRQRAASTTRPGTITLIPDGADGRWDISGGIEVSHVYLTPERLQSCADPLTDGKPVELLGRVGFDDPTSARVLELLAREAAADDTSSRLFVEQGLDLLCTQLIRGHSTFQTLEPAAPRRGLADWQVRRVTAYMRDNLAEEIGLNELAAIVGLSRYHFCTAFRLATGQTPHEWLTRERIERARAMLAVSATASVTEVALAVGYGT